MNNVLLRLTTLSLVASLNFGSCLATANEQIAVAEKPASSPSRLTIHPRSSRAEVYLLRGFLNVFSYGMDDLAEKLRHRGIIATVANHSDWDNLADTIAARYKAGRHGPIVLIGHSLGANAVMSMGEYLGKMGVPVALIVPFDGTSPHTVSSNVVRVFNVYQAEYVKITPGPGFHGDLINYFVGTDANVTHTNIEKNPRYHALVISKIMGLSRSVAPPAAQVPHASAMPKS
jgi:alpha-beta hydrolase superfamily lysophospholipase